jgi:outer membrane protein OmpA-like peptidoglycan-associated protein
MNSGLQFNNKQANGLLDQSFTIELYFKLATINDWKRIIDFKNRTSDNGPYLHKARLNFFNFITGQNIAVKPGKYIHYVYSRDHLTNKVKMYIDGESRIEFNDLTKEGVLSEAGLLNFFQDDLVVNYEASDGAIALIRLYDQVLTPSLIKNNFIAIQKKGIQSLPLIDNIDNKSIISNTPVPFPPPSTSSPQVVVSIPEDSLFFTVHGKVYNSAYMQPVTQANVQVLDEQNQVVSQTTTNEKGYYYLNLVPHQLHRLRVQKKKFATKIIQVRSGTLEVPSQTLTNLVAMAATEPVLTIFFEKDSSKLTNDAIQILSTFLASLTAEESVDLHIEGHTDYQGNLTDKIKLGEDRMKVVQEFILLNGSQLGTITGQSYGPSRPLKSGNLTNATQLNNRVEIYFR